MNQPCQLMTVKEVAELLTCSESSVWLWTATKELPEPIRRGKRWTRWRRHDVERWMEDKSD